MDVILVFQKNTGYKNKVMTFQEYLSYTNRILSGELEMAPYDNPDYFEYTKLNLTRMKRWLKTIELEEETIKVVKYFRRRQHWIVITEPWCGDAAHILPILHLMSELNKKVTLKIELRDSEPFRINKYLTNGTSKSIPILIVKSGEREEFFKWGPRPEGARLLQAEMLEKKVDSSEMKSTIQQWYNTDKGLAIQQEIVAQLKLILEKEANENKEKK